jgi:parallel beta-helix repeat protein
VLTGNTADSNTHLGLGILLQDSSGNILASNTASNNGWGICLENSSGNTLTDNIANSNNECGIYLDSSSSNKIYINNFISNTNNVHSLDGSNTWNSPSELTYTYNGGQYTNHLGNYWDDYTDVDANNDGIWDNPYSINSDNDNYPLVERFENYEIGPDTTPPTVTTVSPGEGAPDVTIDTVVTATFSEAMDSSTITTDSFTLAGSAVSGTVTYDSDTYTAIFTPDANLEYNHEYTATLSTDITDKAGNPLAEAKIWSFTTQSGPVTAKILPVPYYSQDGTEWCVPTSLGTQGRVILLISLITKVYLQRT